MGMSEIIDVIVGILSIISTILAWEIYKLTNTRGMLLFALAITWGMIIRVGLSVSIFVPWWEFTNSSAVISGFWVIFPIGMWEVLKLMKKFYK